MPHSVSITCDTLLALDGGSFPFRSSVREVPPLEESCFASRAIPQPRIRYSVGAGLAAQEPEAPVLATLPRAESRAWAINGRAAGQRFPEFPQVAHAATIRRAVWPCRCGYANGHGLADPARIPWNQSRGGENGNRVFLECRAGAERVSNRYPSLPGEWTNAAGKFRRTAQTRRAGS